MATPILVFTGITLAQRRFSGEQITQFVIIWAVGHHLPGMIRAYGDRELFQQFRLRFILAPILLLAVSISSTVFALHGVFLIGVFWGWWHYVMQTYGFMRIYDAKVGSFARSTQLLDRFMCCAWFAAPLLLHPQDLAGLLSHVYDCGVTLPSAEVLNGIRIITGALVTAITILFLGNLGWQWSKGIKPNPVKLILMALTFTYYWYSVSTMTNLMVSYALFELFHDIQYLTIVWTFNQNRVKQNADLPSFTRFLFRPRVSLILLYLGFIFGYGALEKGKALVPDGTPHNTILGVFVASALLHYYFDGFIWKLRDRSNRTSLAIADEPNGNGLHWTLPRGVRHGLYWSLFVVPLAILTWTEWNARMADSTTGDRLDSISNFNVNILRGKEYNIGKLTALIGSVPDALPMRLQLADGLEKNGERKSAIEQYRIALEQQPTNEIALLGLATALQREGELDESETCYEKLLQRQPDNAKAHYNLGNLHIQRGNVSAAEEHFRTAIEHDPEHARAHNNLGTIFLQAGEPTRAKPLLLKAVRLDQTHNEARMNLASILLREGNDTAAAKQFSAVRQNTSKGRTDRDRRLWSDASLQISQIKSTSANARMIDGPGAVDLAKSVLETGRRDANSLHALASGYARIGDFAQANAAADSALQAARLTNQPALVHEIEQRLQFYRRNLAFTRPARR